MEDHDALYFIGLVCTIHIARSGKKKKPSPYCSFSWVHTMWDQYMSRCMHGIKYIISIIASMNLAVSKL